MSNISTEQLAQILLGIARAQGAIVDAVENSRAGFKATHFRPAIETASRVRANRPETLTDYPARLLLQMIGRTAGPDLASVSRELDRLLSPPEAAPTPSDDPDSLDVTR
jgi:hypothetical protein